MKRALKMGAVLGLISGVGMLLSVLMGCDAFAGAWGAMLGWTIAGMERETES